MCWGNNANGQLGDDTTRGRLEAALVIGLSDVVELSAASSHTCARRSGGEVLCWGDNTNGQLGDGTTTPHSTPTPVTGLGDDVVELSAANSWTCARRSTGEALCWGYNFYGQLGNGTTNSAPTPAPTPVINLGDAVQLSAGSSHMCARRSTGEVVCWGHNFDGQLGDGMTTNQSAPTPIIDLTDVAELSVGGSHSCARRSTGEILCWGDNTFGQLSDGTTTPSSTPSAIVGLGEVVELTSGIAHTCARRSTGEVLCWGDPLDG